MWDKFEEDVEKFEEDYREKLINKLGRTLGEISREEKFLIEKKIEMAVERKFGVESKELVERHLSACILSHG